MPSTEDIQIVKAVEDDAGILALVSQRAFEHASETHNVEPWGPRGYKSAKDHAYYIDRLDTYGITVDDVLIGGVILADIGEGIKDIVRLFVDPDFQDKGIGSHVLDMVASMVEAKEWTAGTIDWNTKNKHFLEKNGFTQIGTIKNESTELRYKKQNEPVVYPKIGELVPEMSRIVVEGKIIEKAIPRSVRSKNRYQTLTVAEATLEDETDDVVLVLWNEQIGQCRVGDRVRIENGYVKEFRGIKQFNVGKTGKLITLI